MRGCDFLMRWGNKEGYRRCGVKWKEYLVTPHKPPYNCEPGGEGWERVARSKYRLQALSSFVCGGDTWYFERKKRKKKRTQASFSSVYWDKRRRESVQYRLEREKWRENPWKRKDKTAPSPVSRKKKTPEQGKAWDVNPILWATVRVLLQTRAKTIYCDPCRRTNPCHP